MDGAGMSWGVKASFRDYVLASPGGRVEADDGAEVDESHMASWPLRDLEPNRLRFEGAIRFSAHMGMLDIELRDPTLTRTETGIQLTIAAVSTTTLIATLAVLPLPPAGGMTLYLGSDVRLTEAGSMIFGGAYPPGAELDPVLIALDARWDAGESASS